MAEIYQLPETGGSNAGVGNIPFSIPLGGNGGMFGNGQTNLMDLLGFAIVASMFPNFFGGRGGQGQFGGMNSDLVMQAVTSQGESTRTAVQTLASSIGQDFNIVYGAVSNVQNALSQIASAQGTNALQVINAIQAGDANLAAQFQKCCCDNQLAICQQTNALQNSINGVGQQVAAKAAADQLAMCQQTYALTENANRNYLALDNKIDAMESSRKDREITALTAQVAKLESQNFTAGIVQQAVAPIISQLNGLTNEVDDIKCKLPNTVNVQYPNLVAMNATPYVSGGFYGQSWNGFGNGNLVF